ncbi:hypothetical protein R1sor_014717 [Riccia sorocarpa]|uniref:Derlin n=1 Tax=Riccia sorocarpa TaxID=122646 RepID=A0ABD3HAH3_9MARC
MSSPAEFYHSLPPISKIYGTACFAFTVAFQLGLLNPGWLYLDYPLVIRKLQIWRLLTNFFFLGPFSMHFGMRMLMIARYGVQLEKTTFENRTADFLYMFVTTMFTALAVTFAVPPLRTFFLSNGLVFMLVYVWSREFATSRVNIMGLQFKGFYLPWALLAVNTMFGAPLLPDLFGIIIGHVYYFLTVLYPRSSGKYLLLTPRWVHNLVAKYSFLRPKTSSTAAPQPPPAATGRAFTGRSYRLSQD